MKNGLPTGIAHSLCADGTTGRQMACVHTQEQDPVVPSKTKHPTLVVMPAAPVDIWVNRGRRDPGGVGYHPDPAVSQSGQTQRC